MNNKAGDCILLALNLCPDRYLWLKALFERLPLLQVSGDILSSECCNSKNAKWSKLFQKITVTACDSEEHVACAQVLKKDVEVYVHKQVPFLRFDVNETKGAPMSAVLSLGDPAFREALRQRVHDESVVSDFTHISLLSGVVLNVPHDVICVVTTSYRNTSNDTSTSFAPCFVTIDATNLGPLYLSFYMKNPNLEKTEEGDVVFHFNFFQAFTKNTTIVQSGEHKLEKTCDRNVYNLKGFADETVETIGQPTLARTSTCEIRLNTHLTLTVDKCEETDRLTVLINPRCRCSVGSHLVHTAGSGTFNFESSYKQSVSEWLPIRKVSQSNSKRGSTFCLSVLSKCLNREIEILLVPKFGSFSYSTKPGYNGYFANLAGEELHKLIHLHYKQLNAVYNQMATIECLVETLGRRYRLLGGQKNSSLVWLRFKKALLYALVVGDDSRVDTKSLEITDESVNVIASDPGLIDAEEMAEFSCFQYDASVEQKVASLLAPSEKSSAPSGTCLMKVLTNHVGLLAQVKQSLESKRAVKKLKIAHVC